jgi:AAA15 family ATPase/GTPase
MILQNLRIENFRLFKNLEFERLGRINLLVGRNNAGKSTVLEALQIYATVGSPKLLQELLESHDEIGPLWFEGFFPDNSSPKEKKTTISIGSTDPGDYLTMKYTYFIFEDPSTSDHEGDEKSLLRRLLQRRKMEVDYQDVSKYDGVRQALKIEARNSRLNQDMVRNQLNPPGVFNVWVDYRTFDENDYEVGDNWLEEHNVSIPYSYVPTHLLPNSVLKVMWNEISATSSSKRVIEALRIIEPKVEGLTFKPVKRVKKNSIEKIEEVPFINIGNDQLVPLKKSGEGMSRLLQLVLSMLDAKGGFLFIDEFENGLHYSIQPAVWWKLIMELATELDVQVFATTHSWDCVKSLPLAFEAFQEEQASKTASETTTVPEPTEFFLFRLGRSVRVRDEGQVIATEYNSEKLSRITQAELEVR